MEPATNIRSLRIGNLVYNSHLERIGYIAGIARSQLTLFHGEMTNDRMKWRHDILDEVAFGDVRPIRLTPSLLEKCGFTKSHSYGESYIIDGIMCLCLKNDLFSWYIEDEYDDCDVNVTVVYLHQLQNIYFDLTGKELDVRIWQSYE